MKVHAHGLHDSSKLTNETQKKSWEEYKAHNVDIDVGSFKNSWHLETRMPVQAFRTCKHCVLRELHADAH